MNPYLLIIDNISTNLIDCSQIRCCYTLGTEDKDDLEINIQWSGVPSDKDSQFTLYFDDEKSQQTAFTEITRRLMAIHSVSGSTN